MHYVVTGGCGFIGSHLVDRLIQLGNLVTVVDDMRIGKNVLHHPEVKYIHKDVCNVTVKEFDTFGEPVSEIIHLANTPRVRLSLKEPEDAIMNNVGPTVRVLEWARELNCTLYFACSSSTQHSDEFSNPYTFSKKVGEGLLRLWGIHYGVQAHYMYFYNVYGPREADYGEYSTVIRAFKNSVLHNKPLRIFGNGNKTRDFTHVEDVIKGIETLLFALNPPRVVHLGTGNPYSINEIADAFDHYSINEFDKPGEAVHTECMKPYIKSTHDVIKYIKEWKARNHNA
jgi:UDP-glucose 4-epimerase